MFLAHELPSVVGVCEMGVRRALGSSVHRPTPGAERKISLVGLYSINTDVCLCITSRAEERSLRNSSDRRPPHVPS